MDFLVGTGDTITTREGAMGAEEKDETPFRVVVNDEEQYSLWPLDKENAPGWKDAGKTGTKAECLAYIREVWTDMRPKRLREKMDRSRREKE